MKTRNVMAPATSPLGGTFGTSSSPSIAPSSNRSFGLDFGSQFWHRLIDAIFGTGELHVWHESDRSGNLLWHAYDPVSGKQFAGSEDEIRQWIEQRYYA